MLLSGQPLSLREIAAIADASVRVQIAPAAMAQMDASRAVVRRAAEDHLPSTASIPASANSAKCAYADDELARLQLNLVRSHACGLGAPLSEPETRVIVALRANTLALGYSGVRPVVAQTLTLMLNRGVHPVIPSKGSVGASGDLAPLAHLALCVIGEGEAIYRGERMPGRAALRARRHRTRPPGSEGRSRAAQWNAGAHRRGRARALARHPRSRASPTSSGAMTLEALLGTPVAFDQRIHAARPHAGQGTVAARLRALLEGSDVDAGPPHRARARAGRVQSALHAAGARRGARRAAVRRQHASKSRPDRATDNPLVFAESGDVLSGGNFHGAPLSLAFDTAAIALTTLAGIAERRIDRLVNPDLNQGLPAFLAAHPGVSSGFMIGHVAAVSLLNECKVLAHPASVDNVPTSGGQEDHVSMGMTAALKLRTIVENGEYIAAIELLAAAEALRYREPFEPGPELRRVRDVIRTHRCAAGRRPPALHRYRERRSRHPRRASLTNGQFRSRCRLRCGDARSIAMSLTTAIRAPRGTSLRCQGWHQEAALRMLHNNLDPDVAENPDELIVYGGTGRAARDWPSFHAMVRALESLGNDETLLVQSGKPVGIFRTHPESPRVLLANSNLVGHWSNWDEFNRLEKMGLTMYGQMTAGSWIYIGSQGIVQGTYETFASLARKHFGGSLAGKLVVSGGMGGMGGAQPLAATMNGARFLGIEVDAARIQRRLETGYCDRMARTLEEALAMLAGPEAISVALVGNCADVLPEMARRGIVPDVLTDQTSAHDPLNGYVPNGMTLEEARLLRARHPEEYVARSMAAMGAHVRGHAGTAARPAP